MADIQPLVIPFSFTGARTQATDQVDLASLDAAFALVTAKLNECITALNMTLAADNTLADNTVGVLTISPEAWAEIAAVEQGGTPPA
jgi:hypothetical protein